MRIRVFISSVQKELADERLALQILLSTDPFLSTHCTPVLFEEHPAGLHPDPNAYLQLLKTCHVYLAILWKEYGNQVDGLSATHSEYRLARQLNLPALVTIKGSSTLHRDLEKNGFIDEIRSDGHTYDRFNNIETLQKKVRVRLVKHIKDTYDLEPTSDQEQSASQTILVASLFERQRLDLLPWDQIQMAIASQVVSKAEERPVSNLRPDDIRRSLWQRGYLWRNDANEYFATAAGMLLLAPDPSKFFAHCRILMAFFSGMVRTANPQDHQTIRKPLPTAIDDAVAFIRKNTRHPLRVVGLQRIEVDEYPEAALREALVNALAHRDYEDSGRRVNIDIFHDRIEIVSPGPLAGNLTLAKLRAGRARSRSRNPNIAQGLVFLGRMEERGTGIQRMQDAMLDHGLERPVFTMVDDEVIVTLPGPGNDLDRIRTPEIAGPGLSPAVEARMNKRQKIIHEEAVRNGSVTTGWCIKQFGVARDTAIRDMNGLVDLQLVEPRGRGRGRHYVPKL